MKLHFQVGDELTGPVSTFDTREEHIKILSVAQKRPLTYNVSITIDPHRSEFVRSVMGSGIEHYSGTKSDERLKELVRHGWYKTSNEQIQKLREAELRNEKNRRKVPLHSGSGTDPDEEYWNAITEHGSEEERAEAADYFDVTPNAFDEDYQSARR